MRQTLAILLTALALFTGCPHPVAAAEDHVATAATYQEVVRDARELLRPVAQQRGLTFSLDVDGASALAPEAGERTRNRVLSLMANAVALAPGGSRVNVHFDTHTCQLQVTILDSKTSQDTDREVVDPAGNAFRIVTVAGQGAELNASLLDAPLTLHQ